MINKSQIPAQISCWTSIIGNLILASFKFWAGLMIGSVSIIADAWHTLSDSVTSVIVIIGLKLTNKPADREHPFGHGRAEIIATLIIAVLLGVVSFNFCIESINRLIARKSIIFNTFALLVMIISVIIKESMARYAIYAGKKSNFKALFADAWHHRSDGLASLLIVIGILCGSYFWWIDGVLGVLVSILILYTAFSLARDSINPLLGEQPEPELIEQIKQICSSNINNSFNVHHFHIHRYGQHSELIFHLKFTGNIYLKDAHKLVTTIEKIIKDKLQIETTIHLESGPDYKI
jgi:cation diffusion facilitator family transporter